MRHEIGVGIQRGIEFLTSGAHNTGGWVDFPTRSSGASTSWVTAYVLCTVGSLLPDSVRAAAVNALLGQVHKSGGWGFSEYTPPDCDSTIHAVGALLTVDKTRFQNQIERGIEFILTHQQPDGGFSTYANAEALAEYRKRSTETDYHGWLQSHGCVTAAAVSLFKDLGDAPDSRRLTSAVRYLLSRHDPVGYWPSYWWRSRYFATSRILTVLLHYAWAKAAVPLHRAVEWIISTQRPDGAWTNGVDTEEPCVLSTSLCISVSSLASGTRDAALRGVGWCLAKQDDDGSWPSQPCMQIPPPSCVNPLPTLDWHFDGRGVGSCCRDTGRIYTTASAIQSLYCTLEGSGQCQ